MRAYVLVETGAGEAQTAKRGLEQLDLADTKVLSVDVVIGPCDVIVQFESPDLDKLGLALSAIEQVEGLRRTATCLVIRLS